MITSSFRNLHKKARDPMHARGGWYPPDRLNHDAAIIRIGIVHNDLLNNHWHRNNYPIANFTGRSDIERIHATFARLADD